VKDISAKKAADTIVNAAVVAVHGVADAGIAVGESTLEAYGATKEGLKKASTYAVEKAQRAKKAADALAVETPNWGLSA